MRSRLSEATDASGVRGVEDPAQRRERLKAVYVSARGCVACPLHRTRTQVVFGAGAADAELMFIGEGPGANEDREGVPFVGRAGGLLQTLLEEIGLSREEVFIANVVKCRPPGNRDPHPEEIAACAPYLRAQVELVRPRVICTLGNFATKLLREDPTGITRLHGQAEVRVLAGRRVRLLPLFHPAAALYAPSSLQTLRDDFAIIPGLLAAPGLPDIDTPTSDPRPTSEPQREPEPEEPLREPVPHAPAGGQLGLF